MANIFKLHEYQTFGLMKMHNMCKIWFANNIFSQFVKKVGLRLTAVKNAIFYFLHFPFTQISKDYCQKSYNGFWGLLVISTTSEIFLIYKFLKMKPRPLIFFFDFHGYAFWFFIFSKWKKHDNLPFDDTFKMYCCALY